MKNKRTLIEDILIFLGGGAIGIILFRIIQLIGESNPPQNILKIILVCITVTLVIVSTILGALNILKNEKK